MHKAKIIHWRGKRYRIDELIAPLLLNMWRLGIKTHSSCQGSCGGWCDKRHRSCEKVDRHGVKYSSVGTCHDHVVLWFERAEDANNFANVVAKWGKNDPIYDKIIGVGPKKGRWTWNMKMDNLGVRHVIKRHRGRGKHQNFSYYDEFDCPKNKFSVFVAVIFPRKDLPYVEKMVEKALLKRKKR